MRKQYLKVHSYIEPLQLQNVMESTEKTIYITESGDGIKASVDAEVTGNSEKSNAELKCCFEPLKAADLGDKSFMETYGTKYAYYGGAMANGISSPEMVIELAKRGFMGSLGTGGISLDVVEGWIDKIQAEVDKGYLVNFLSSPGMSDHELNTVKLFLKKKIHAIEASAFIEMTSALVYYRLAGLKKGKGNSVICENHIIAKISRNEVAQKFMSPPPVRIVKELLGSGLITEEQASLSQSIPMADDITVEADSGGHTDNRPLVSLLPDIIALAKRIQKEKHYSPKIRIGAGGGISTPESALAAFSMGAAYVVTGSVNQSCLEAGTSDYVKKMLSETEMQDVVMAPCADMFEMGTCVQVIKKGTMYPMNAQRLYNMYCSYNSISEIPEKQLESIEKRMFHSSVDDVWNSTKEFFAKRDPSVVVRAEKNEKQKMALIFRWYLGNSSRWAITGDKSRLMDMQIWCGQSMGAFNNCVKGTKLEKVENRKVADIADFIMKGAAYCFNINFMKMNGMKLDCRYTV